MDETAIKVYPFCIELSLSVEKALHAKKQGKERFVKRSVRVPDLYSPMQGIQRTAARPMHVTQRLADLICKTHSHFSASPIFFLYFQAVYAFLHRENRAFSIQKNLRGLLGSVIMPQDGKLVSWKKKAIRSLCKSSKFL
ncbi:MAG: hypothetical protein A3F09_00975 [Chlamydiae bacterium RIFCSPHIGHO2_12_FULL_49_11]|nr:MAG: hypothetical protein A3F09_00975 [Chlamydiae bacterium RIFCSPHIGHO2_12_FULL_49_11]